ncbi:PorP/SprF family type IX secretion system membrane protein [Mucilaginibacter sp. Bleaf8]|uniref:PorP/SprF family type IX secretion system membrane protein n=1 Tax=Mucilaginibacter sp. Bleaf8 TaxID=2834430 RepID=UPI001BCC4CA8|nr:PorP/SprF family type IX secretion system membrane protein [Mucilaginibacter sp. Bleaf8]MBS7565234.1 PorP/SprF family type IX secretion system membrane protein [Mucilaginibacter sp. Bleaf8]
MKQIRIYFFSVAMLLCTMSAWAQDHMYSQFFNSPVYLNPALNGQFEGDFRMNMIYRNQWASVPGSLSYITASADYNIPKFGAGVGVMFTRSNEGTAYFLRNNLAGIYSYSVGSDDFVLSFGLQAGIGNRTIDRSKLVFGDQIDPQYGYIPGSQSAADLGSLTNKFYFDAGAGVNLVVGEFMVGSALQHINRPDQSFTGAPAKLPMRATAHVSYRWDLNPYDNIDEDEKSYVIPSVVLYKQAASSSLNVGLQYKRRSVNAGVWYRSGGNTGPSAFVVSFIFDLFINREGGEKLRFGLSHDAPTSKLNYSATSGTTEGSIGYETTIPSRNSYHKFEGSRRCYDFY